MKTTMRLLPVLLATSFAAASSELGAQDYQALTRLDTTVRIERGGTVDLSLISGTIKVTGWDRPDVKVVASLESGTLDFDANPSRVSLSVDHSEDRRGHHHNDVGEARYEVSVPRGVKLILEGVSGDVTASGSRGEIEASSVSGNVRVTEGVGQVNAEAVSGSVTVSQVNGNLRAESVSGDVRADNVTGNVQASSVSGDLRLSGVRSRDVRTETVSGEVTYTGTIEPNGKYSFESHSGTIRLNIPKNAGAQVSVETFSGDISTPFPMLVRPSQSRRREGHMEFTIGDGRARITAQTFSGRIVIDDDTDSTTRRDQ
jgi:DUF4097 and DUF4098 domain-containing protein YvlB